MTNYKEEVSRFVRNAYYVDQTWRTDHLFIHCKTTANLWHKFLCILGVSRVMTKTTLELLNSWKGIGRRNGEEHRGQIIPACIWWVAWKERNSRLFEDSSKSIHLIRMNCLSFFLFWCKLYLLEDTGDPIELIGKSIITIDVSSLFQPLLWHLFMEFVITLQKHPWC